MQDRKKDTDVYNGLLDSDIDWRFNSYMIVYMLECHSPKSSHPLPLSLSPKSMFDAGYSMLGAGAWG